MKRLRMVLLLTTAVALAAGASAQTIETYAGGIYLNYPALDVALGPTAVAYSPDGSLYVANYFRNEVDRLDPATGHVSTVAGNGITGYSGDGGAATSASLSGPLDVTVDASGNLYIADQSNGRIRKVSAATGVITTVAGNGDLGYSGDGGSAADAGMVPYAIAVDAAGNLYIADANNARVRKVEAATGLISTVAGNGNQEYSGDGGPATSAGLNRPIDIAIDTVGDLYIADANNARIRKVEVATGLISTVAGDGLPGYSGDGGLATDAAIDPIGIAVDAAGDIYIADGPYNHIRKLTVATGFITTVAGNGSYGFTGEYGSATTASLSVPSGIAVDPSGNLYIADENNARVRKVEAATNLIYTVAGNGSVTVSGDGRAALGASLYSPTGVAVDGSRNLYIADTSNGRIRKVEYTTGLISTVAGGGNSNILGDGGTAVAAGLAFPRGVAVDSGGSVYIADTSHHRVRIVDSATGLISTFAGNGSPGFAGDGGAAVSARLRSPTSIALDAAGNVYIADTANVRIRKVTAATGVITTVAGNGVSAFSGDGSAAIDASLYTPVGVALDAAGNLYIADANDGRIRMVSAATGIIATVAGNGDFGYSGDGGPAVAAGMAPAGIAVDSAGNLYIPDANNARVLKVAADTGLISTAAGNGTYGFSGDGGPATSASLANPSGIAVDSGGNGYIADTGNNRIRRVIGLATPADSTPPVIQPHVLGTTGANGWFTGDVAVSWDVTDSESSIDSKSGCDAISIATDTAGQTLTCTATSTGGTATQSTTVKRDATPPTAVATAAPAPNGNGWNAGNVTVHVSGTDVTSGIASCTADQILSAEAAGQSASGTCTDKAGNVSATVSVSGIKLDKTAPVVSATKAPTANGLGWNNTAVTVSFSATDTLSGVAVPDCDAPVTLSTDGSGQSAAGTCRDRAGNVGSASVGDINIDRTAPTAVATVTPAASANGWNNTDVTVSFTGTDALSGSGIASCSPSVTLTSEGAGQYVPGACIDKVGNISFATGASVSIDKTAPTEAITTPNGGTYTQGSVVNAAYSCADTTSGVDSCTGTVVNGATIDTSSAGTHAFAVSATDKAGNTGSATSIYTVTAAVALPVITPALAGTAGANGWYTSNVSLTWTIASTTTVISSTGCNARTITSNTASTGVTYTCTATNTAGTASQSVTIYKDSSPPTATAHATPRANTAGWNRTAVTVTFVGNDGQSRIASCTPPVALVSEGTGLGASGQCTNNAGLVSPIATASGIDIDLTVPSVTIATPANRAVYARNAAVTADYACSDALSGVALCNGPVANGATISTATRGTKTFRVRGRDAAGNTTLATVSYTVQ